MSYQSISIPSDIDNCKELTVVNAIGKIQHWWDASQLDSLFSNVAGSNATGGADGDNVRHIDDRRGSHLPALTTNDIWGHGSVENSRPGKYRPATVNGLPVVEVIEQGTGTGGANITRFASNSLGVGPGAPWTIFYVFQPTAPTAANYESILAGGFNGANAADRQGIWQFHRMAGNWAYVSASPGFSVNTGVAYAPSDPTLFTIDYTAAQDLRIWFGTTLVGSTNNSTSLREIKTGNRWGNSTIPGYFCELIIATGMSDEDISLIREYVRCKWGVS